MDNNKLLAMLGGAKKVMDKVETGKYKIDPEKVNEAISGNVELLSEIPEGVNSHNPTRRMVHTYQNLEKSKMPQAVKDLMINNPITPPTMASGGGPTFSLEDVASLVNPDAAQTPQYKYQNNENNQTSNQNNTQPLRESHIVNSRGQMLITLTEAELDKKINDALLNFMATTFTKNLTENTIKKTITTLIKEGKIKVKPKTR